MTHSWRKILCVSAICCGLTGCAQNLFRASELPGRYAAKRVRNYSTMDFARFAQSVTTDADIIREGDRLQVKLDDGTLTEESEHIWSVSVDESGQTTLPNIGAVRLAGLTRTNAEKTIVQASLQRDVFLTPVVEVQVGEREERTIFVAGAVKKPGPITITRDEVSLADVIVRAGGLAEAASGVISVSAGTQNVQPTVVQNQLQPITQSTTYATTVSLENTSDEQFGKIMVPEGAVVNVESVPQGFVRVMGAIRAKSVEIPPGDSLRMLDALTLAGGQNYSNWISDRVTITRQDPKTGKAINIRASIRKARKNASENLLLAPYDVVNVDENIFTFTLSTVSGFLGAGFNASRLAL